MSWTLVVDFGTSSTAVAVLRAGGSPELVSFGGVPRIPSVVLAPESGGLVVGLAAEQQLGVAPERAERTPKRRLGDPVMLMGSRSVRPVEAVAAILGAVAEEAIRQQGGERPSEVRLTHPARWGSVRLRALAEATAIAGLPVPSFVSEPVAAALYFSDDRVAVGDHVAVYDLGGGTFDTAVLRRVDGGFEVAGVPGGDERLGGESFDDRLFDHIGNRLGERYPDSWEALRFSEERAWRKACFDVRVEARRAKEALSSSSEYTMYLGAPVDAEMVVTREEFESLIQADVVGSVDELENTVSKAGIAMSDLAAVAVVGGSSRIPLVTRLVADRAGVMPQTWGDPKAAVVLGAGLALQLQSVPSASSTGSASTVVGAAPSIPLPKQVGSYQVLAELGRGGMGVVYLARQESLGRLVAVKTLPSLDGSLTARLEREAGVLATLQHPHISPVLDIGTDDRGTHVVMPFFAGGTLSHLLDRDGRLSAGQTAMVLAAVADALAATHASGFLHRDVKPSNILLSGEGDPYLADFGLALPLLESSRMTNSRAVLGTAPYTAPEVIADEVPGPAADVYSLGICGYQLLAGRLPFTGSNVLSVLDAIRRGAADPLDEVVPDAPDEIVTLISQAMDPEAENRPTDLRAWAAAIRASVESEAVVPAPPASWMAAVAAAGLVAAGDASAEAGPLQSDADGEPLTAGDQDSEDGLPSVGALVGVGVGVGAGVAALAMDDTSAGLDVGPDAYAEDGGSYVDGADSYAEADADDDDGEVPWWRRKKVLVPAIAAAVLLFGAVLAGTLSGGGDEEVAETKASAKQTTTTTTIATTVPPVTEPPTTVPPPVVTEPPVVPPPVETSAAPPRKKSSSSGNNTPAPAAAAEVPAAAPPAAPAAAPVQPPSAPPVAAGATNNTPPAPNNGAGGAPPPAAPPTDPLVANNDIIEWIPECRDGYVYWDAQQGGYWCSSFKWATLSVLNNDSGPYNYVEYLSGSLTHDVDHIIEWDGYGYQYQPHWNGNMSESFTYRLRNTDTGAVSNTATVTVYIDCNWDYSIQCI